MIALKHITTGVKQYLTLTSRLDPFSNDLHPKMMTEGDNRGDQASFNSGIVLVEMPRGKSQRVLRGPIKVEGKLSLNGTDPENFLYTIDRAKVSEGE
mgnify:CR=1 FL=1